MSEDQSNQPETPKPVLALKDAESQHQRWMKYGANVAMMSIIAIALVSLLVYLAEAHPKRIDTTVGGAQSLSPQTVNIVKNLKGKFRIVALYPKLKSEADEANQQDHYQPVVDLLNEYAAKGSNIGVEVIDPNTEKDSFNKLVSDVTNQYGGEVKDYKAIIADLPAQIDALNKFTDAEDAKFKDWPLDNIQDVDVYNGLARTINSVQFTKPLKRMKEDVDADLSQAIPSYKEAVDRVQGIFATIDENLTSFVIFLTAAQSEPQLPKQIKDYIPDALKRAAEIQKPVKAMLARFEKLGQLKELNEFKDQLKMNSIVVMGDAGYKIIPDDKIWTPEAKNPFTFDSGEPQRNRFAGEQQISMAIAALADSNKQMVVFVQPAGYPSLIGPRGDFGAVADRLREYNFDVQEKKAGTDFSQRPEPPTPEPTDEQMKTAVWIVFNAPPPPNPMGMPMPSPIEPMLEQHIKDGGSALVLMIPQPLLQGPPGQPPMVEDPLSKVFDPLGVKVRIDLMLLHETVPQGDRRNSDQMATLGRGMQVAFLLNQYGKHPLVAPLQDLDTMMFLASPVQVMDSIPPGVTVTPILPAPTSPHTWASSKFEGRQLAFNPSEDLDSTAAKPLSFAAAIEKAGAGRVVVIGSFLFLKNELMNMPDEKNSEALRLPGNGELVMDSVFWLAHRDSMLAISSHALQMARVKSMSSGKLNFYRIGILTAGLPLVAILAGLMVFYKRRD